MFASSDIQISDYSVKTPEWIQLSNTTSDSIIINGWYFKDTTGNIKTIDGCISSNSTKLFEYSGFLNDTGDSLSLYDNNNILIQEIGVLDITQKEKPISTNSCIITPTPTILPPTNTPTATIIPSNTPTSILDSTIINPTFGVSISEFMPYSSIEWIEIYNNNSNPVEIKGWKIKDNSSNTKTIPDLKISSNSFAVFEFSSFLNNDFDKIILINHLDQEINQFEYPNNKDTLERSWSLINNSWCQSDITKNSTNVSSCYSEVTSTPTITASVTPSLTPKITPTTIPTDRYLYKPDELATATAVFTPTEETDYYLTPTILAKPISSNLVLGETTTAKKNYLPLVFIISGGSLLISPIIIEKLKKK